MIFEIEPTTRCNLRCMLCSHAANHSSVKDDEMSREDWLHNLSHFLPEDELVITGGEPTLYKDLEFIIDTWVEKFNKPVLRISSNGHNWQRLLPMQDKITSFNISYYPGGNDSSIHAFMESDLRIKLFCKMDNLDLWNVWFAPENFELSTEAIKKIPKKCGLTETKAVCKRHVWPCCVGGYFYRNIKGLPQFHGGIEIGSSNWRARLKSFASCRDICRYCWIVPILQLAPGELIPLEKRKPATLSPSNIDYDEIFKNAFKDHKNGKLEEAISGYHKVLSNNPEHPSALYLLGIVMFDRKEYFMAVPMIQKSLDLSPNTLNWQLSFGKILKEVKKKDGYTVKPINSGLIVSVYQRALAIDPECVEALSALGALYMESDDFTHAYDIYYDLLQIQPDNQDALSACNRIIENIFQQAYSNHEKDLTENAEIGYRKILNIQPNHPDASHMLGIIEYDRGNYDAALTLIEKSIEISSPFVKWLLNYGNVLKKTKQMEKALAVYRKALSIEPDNINTKETLGDFFYETGDYREARRIYDSILTVCGNELITSIKYSKAITALAESESTDGFQNWIKENRSHNGQNAQVLPK